MISSSSTHPKANTIKSPDTQQHMQTQNPPIFKIFITPTWHAQRIRHLQPPKANTINPFLNPPDTQNKCTQSPLNQNYSKPSESSSSITCTKNHHLRPFPRPTRFKWLPQFPRHPNQNQMHTPTQPTQNPFPPWLLSLSQPACITQPLPKTTQQLITSTQSVANPHQLFTTPLLPKTNVKQRVKSRYSHNVHFGSHSEVRELACWWSANEEQQQMQRKISRTRVRSFVESKDCRSMSTISDKCWMITNHRLENLLFLKNRRLGIPDARKCWRKLPRHHPTVACPPPLRILSPHTV